MSSIGSEPMTSGRSDETDGSPVEGSAQPDGEPVLPGPRARLQAKRGREARARRTMAVLTLVCLLSMVLGWAAEISGEFPRALVISLYVLGYVAGGSHSVVRALRALAAGSLSVDFLMVLAALGAASIGEWPEGGVLLFLFSLSNTLEEYVLGRTRRAIEDLMDLSPEEAVVRRDGREQRIRVEELRAGDTLIVRPAERIAADGVVQAGRTSIDQAVLTGESLPVSKAPGDPVFAGTLNQQGAIEVEVTRVADETALARIVRLVEEAQRQPVKAQSFVDWFGARYTVGVIVLAAATFAVRTLATGESADLALYQAMTVLVAASPCAVVVAAPAAILSAITSAARGGVLFKGGAYLERAARIRAIAYDKTGTLTIGQPRVVEVRAADGVAAEDVLQLAASAESRSEHPLAQAVVKAAQVRGLALSPATDVEAIVGRGLRAQVGSREVWVGKPDLFAERGCAIPGVLAGAAGEFASHAMTTVFVGDEGQVLGLLAIADVLRPSAREAIDQLRRLGIECQVILTGDNPNVARVIAEALGLDFKAGLLPEEKMVAIKELQETYGMVAMVGDGINDAPSLAAATLGISLGGAGTDVALETADIVLMADDLRHLPYAVALARGAERVIRQSLVFACAVIIGLLGVAFFGSLALPYAVAGHEGSTVLVILNGLRLLAFPRPATVAAS